MDAIYLFLGCCFFFTGLDAQLHYSTFPIVGRFISAWKEEKNLILIHMEMMFAFVLWIGKRSFFLYTMKAFIALMFIAQAFRDMICCFIAFDYYSITIAIEFVSHWGRFCGNITGTLFVSFVIRLFSWQKSANQLTVLWCNVKKKWNSLWLMGADFPIIFGV